MGDPRVTDPPPSAADDRELAVLNLSAGSFSLEDLLGHFDYPLPDEIDPAKRQVLTEGMSTSEKVAMATKQLASLHETRHLHDALGTYAGITFFLTHMEMLRQFAASGVVMAARGQSWPFPFLGKDYDSLPAVGKQFIRLAIRVLPVARRFRGDLPSLILDLDEVPEPLPHVAFMKEDLTNSPFVAFPSQIRAGAALNVPRIQCIPLAFDAILEGNAQAFQRSAIKFLWGDAVADTAFFLLGATINPRDPISRAPTYNVTDLMISRYLRNNGFETFWRQTVLALSDRALAGGWLRLNPASDDTYDVEMACAGGAFLEELQACTLQALVDGDIPPYPVNEGYVALRDELASLLDEPAEGLPPLKDIQLLRNWTLRSIILPLLDARIQTEGRLLADFECYYKHFLTLPPGGSGRLVPGAVDQPTASRPPGWCIDTLLPSCKWGRRFLRYHRLGVHGQLQGLHC
jgi:hypothetical protein